MRSALTLLAATSLAFLFACGGGEKPAPIATLEGRVTLQGQSDSSGVSVVLAGTAYSASTRADGTFQLPNVAPGTYQLLASYPGYARAGADVEATDGTVTVPSLELIPVVSTGHVSGKATLEGASDSSAISITVPGTSFAASTDAAGAYALDLPPGDYTLDARAPGFVGQSTQVHVEAGADVTASALVLPRAFTSPPLIAWSTLGASFPGALFSLEGLHFGDEQGESAVYLGADAVADIVSWSDEKVLFHIPEAAAPGVTSLSIVVGGQQATLLFKVVAGPKVIPIAGGNLHSVAIAADGHVVGWGNADHGATTPPQGLTNVVQVTAGDNWSAALKADGTVTAWGDHANGWTDITDKLTGVVMLGGSGNTPIALRADGTVVGWGYNQYGQLNGLEDEHDVVSVSAGDGQAVVVHANGSIAVYGDNSAGQRNLPMSNANIIGVSTWGFHLIALRGDGSVKMWGSNYYGQCNVPSGLPAFSAVVTGLSHSLALKPDGTVMAWGNNYYGEANVPGGLSNVVAVGAGNLTSFAVKADGTVVSWGPGQMGSAWVPAGLVVRVP